MAVAMYSPMAVMASKPTGEFEVFGDCPLTEPHIIGCVYSTTTSGEVKIGSTAVPISKTIVFQGGVVENLITEEKSFVGAADGNTLTKVAQTVPGGLLGIVAPEGLPKWLQEIFNEFINKGITGVTATTELVGSPEYNFLKLAESEGVGLVLPVRIHLNNTFLGGECYIGSSAEPINLRLTTGTTSPPLPNKAITGSPGTAELRDGGELTIATGTSVVDNSFAVPGASGCGGILSFLVDPVVDLKLGLPSAAGHNTAILDGTLEQAAANAVIASEK